MGVFANGRVNAFQAYTRGDSYPIPLYDPAQPGVIIHTAKGGGIEAFATRPLDATGVQLSPGTIRGLTNSERVSVDVFGFGVRRQPTQWTTATAYMSIWAFIESEAHRKYRPVPADVREGYVKLEGPWGSLLAGRALTLFSRGVVEIDYLYAHGYGAGFPGSIDVNGPTGGRSASAFWQTASPPAWPTRRPWSEGCS